MRTRLNWLLALLFVAALPMSAQQQDSGRVVKAPPKGMTEQQVIERFAAREKEFKDARENYTFRQSVKVQTLDGTTVTGEYQQIVDVTFDDKDRRRENVVFSPQSTLREIEMTREDFDDLQHRYPFVLTTDELPEYQILYVGQEHIDELDTYVFDIAPKAMGKGKRYFQGRIWVDDRDFQIVKSFGKPVGDATKSGDREQQFPAFATYREQVDDKYWFPTYSRADEVLHFPPSKNSMGSDVHIRIIVKYTDYKRFGSKTRITFGDQEIKPDPPKK
ncbi:MAG TPA: hypothetical protein VM056_07230 [Terriglobales bacterium]|nr:hypothetical protein [Terriglobales bacterium]